MKNRLQQMTKVIFLVFLIFSTCTPENSNSSTCGNSECETGEDSENCPLDCEGNSVCGNKIKEYGEDCDGGDFGSSTCITAGFNGGNIGCTDLCLLETSFCTGCNSNCTTLGALQCSGDKVEICAYENECTMWLLGEDCGAKGETCSTDQGTAQCSTPLLNNINNCQSTCTNSGHQRCNGYTLQTCLDSDGCLTWSDTSDCSTQNMVCLESQESAACASQCSTVGAQPSGGTGGQTGETTQTLNGRSCLVYVPTNISSTNCLPYMQVYHGYGATVSQPYDHWLSAAQTKNFILVSVPFTGPGTGDGAHANIVRSEMSALYNMDMHRCFLGGFSAGAQQALEIVGSFDGWSGANLVSTGAAHTTNPGPGTPPVSLYWLFGDADTTFGGISAVTDGVSWYQSWGFNVNFTSVPGGTHSIYINNPNTAWDWLYLQP
jgi:hypothetical protein